MKTRMDFEGTTHAFPDEMDDATIEINMARYVQAVVEETGIVGGVVHAFGGQVIGGPANQPAASKGATK